VNPSIVFEGKWSAKACEVLPWLVKYAEAKNTVEYGELGKAVGVHPHAVLPHVLNTIGKALEKSDPDIPKIQLIVINRKPGTVGTAGLGWLVSAEQIPGLSPNQKEALCQGAQKKVFDYRYWGEILAKCDLEHLSLGAAPLETLLEDAVASISYGGEEGEDHRILKEYVKAYPGCIGLKQRFTRCSTESKLLSGDEMDVFFESPAELVCIEVKGRNSCEADIRRGIFQCIKYRAVLEAQELYRNDGKTRVIGVFLVLASGLSEELERLAKLLKIPIKPNVSVPQNFVAPDKNGVSAPLGSLRRQAANTP